MPLEDNIDGRMIFNVIDGEFNIITFFPYFHYEENELQNIVFKISEIEEWKNRMEAVFDGEIFDKVWFGFFCQNYIEYKQYNVCYTDNSK